MVRILKLHEADEATIMKLLPRYKSISRQDADFEIELYKKIYFESYSTRELAEMNHMDQSAIYRRIKKVDNFIKKNTSSE